MFVLTSETQHGDAESDLSEDEFCRGDEEAEGGQKLEDDAEDNEVCVSTA